MNNVEKNKIEFSNKIHPYLAGFSDDLMFWAAINTLFLTILKGFHASQISLISAISIFISIIVQKIIFKIIKKMGNLLSFRFGLVLLLISAIMIIISKSIYLMVIAYVIYHIAFYFTNMGSVILKRNLKALNKEDDFVKLQSRASLVYAISTMIISFISGFIFNINMYLPMIICVIICLINIFMSKYIYEYKDNDLVNNNAKKEKNKVNWTKVIIYIILVYGLLYATVETLQENGKIFIQYRMQDYMTVSRTSIYLTIIIAFSRISRVLSDVFFNKLYSFLKKRFIILLNILLFLSALFMILGYIISFNVISSLVMALGFIILLFVRDPIMNFTKNELLDNCRMKDQEEVIHKYNLCRRIVRCIFATTASLILLKIDMMYLIIILLGLAMLYLPITINLYKKLIKNNK